MLLELRLPTIVPAMSTALIEAVYVAVGAELNVGDRILDLTIDLGVPFAQDCPPVSHYRLVARERARVVEALASVGDDVPPDGLIARLATSSGDPTGNGALRAFRIAVVGILRHSAMLSSRAGA